MDTLKGIASFSFGIYVWSVFFSLFYRFPSPMVGYVGPYGEFESTIASSFGSAAIAFIFYSIVGGFIVIFPVGAACGNFIKSRFSHLASRKVHHLVCGLAVGFVPVLVLATLDYIIGPW